MVYRPGYIWNGTEWVSFGPDNIASIPYQASEPTSPQIGDLWIDSDGDTSLIDMSSYSTTSQIASTYSPISTTGLVLISTYSFTNSSGISINNCFTSTYDNYRLIWNIKTGGFNTSHRMRLRSNGTDLTSTSYYQAGFYVADNSSTGTAFCGNNSFLDLNYTDPGMSTFSGDIHSPYLAAPTHISGMVNYGVSGVVVERSSITSGRIANELQYDGATFYPSSGTMTGTLQIYGYRK